MEEKKEIVKLDDLFSFFKEKQSLNKKNSFITKDEIDEILFNKEYNIDLIKKTLVINQDKLKIIEKSKKLNYSHENINIFLFNILGIWMGLMHIFLLIIFLLLGVTTIFGLYIYSFEAQKEIPYLNLSFCISLVCLTLCLIGVKKNNWNFTQWISAFIYKIKEKFLNVCKKTIFRKCHNDTFEYLLSNYKSTLYYENKTDNKLYNNFLLQEINILEDINIAGDSYYEKDRAEDMLLRTKVNYEIYTNQIKELKLLKKLNR